jgi:hypothetical protein
MSIFFLSRWLKRASQSPRRSGQRPKHTQRRVHYCRPRLEPLEDRTLLNATLLNNFTGLGFTSSGGSGAPPDTNGAAGPTSYVEAVNQAVAIYSPKTTGAAIAKDSLSDFYFTKGGLPHVPVMAGNTDGQSDCFVIWDSQVQRFIVGDLDFELDSTGSPVNNGGNALLLAVSKSASPATLTSSDWFFYSVPTTEAGVALQDYPGNPGYNHDALVVTFNSFSTTGFLHAHVATFSINALINGQALTNGTNTFQTDFATFGLRPAIMHDSVAGDPMWMAQTLDTVGNFAAIQVVKMTNVLSANPTFTPTTLAVNPYAEAVPPLQPNGQPMTGPGFIDSRILKTAEQNGILVAADTVSNAAGNLDNARWYAIDVSSGTPVLQQQGDVTGGPGVYDTYPGIDINPQGQIGMSFISSGTAPGQFASVFVTGRTPSDPVGTMETPVLVQAGAANYVQNFGVPRQGDLSGISVDADGTFWIANEYANTDAIANWGTAIGHFTLAPPVSVILTNAVEGQPLFNVPVATFLDHSGAAVTAYNVTIFWGDGSSSAGAVVANGGGNFTVLGTHTYLEEGQFTLTVTVKTAKSDLGSASGIVTVADAPLLGFAQAANSQVGAFPNNVLVAVFQDTDSTPESPSNYTALIQWLVGGLPVTTVGRITPLFGTNTFAVFGDYPFSLAAGGLFTIRVTVQDVGGASVVVNSSLAVANSQVIPPLFPLSASDVGPFGSEFVTLQDALTNLLMAERLFFVAMAFGTAAQQQNGFANLINAFFAYQTAVFNFDMSLPGS